MKSELERRVLSGLQVSLSSQEAKIMLRLKFSMITLIVANLMLTSVLLVSPPLTTRIDASNGIKRESVSEMKMLRDTEFLSFTVNLELALTLKLALKRFSK